MFKRPRRTLKSAFLTFLIPIIVVFVTVTGTVSYLLAARQLEANAETSMNDTLVQTRDSLNEKLAAVLGDVTALGSNSELQMLIRRADQPGFKLQPRDYLTLAGSLDKLYTDHYAIIESVYLYYNQGRLSYYRKDRLQTERIPEPGRFFELPYTVASRIYWFNLTKNEWDPAGGRTAGLYQWIEGRDEARGGLIVIRLKEALFEAPLTAPEISPNGYLVLASTDGLAGFKTVESRYAAGEEELRRKLLEAPGAKGRFVLRSEAGQALTVVYDTLAINKWRLAAVYPEEELYSRIQYIQTITLSVVIAVIVLAVLSTGWLTNRITRPLSGLTRRVHTIREGRLEVELPDHPGDAEEIRILNRGIRDMLGRIRELLGQVEYEQEQKRLHELSVLQSQIQPHFLYNTLYSIKSLCDLGETKDASKMLAALSSYYRISISKGSPVIAVSAELEHIGQYLYIQQMRYGDTFHYETRVEEAMLNCRIVKLTLQPLVENAIYHGVKKVRRTGRIEVRGWIEEGVCLLQVKDNGFGMEPERLRLLQMALAEENGESTPGIGYGVRNVHRRLQLHYGRDYGLTYESGPGEGTTVTVRFPYMEHA
ncbi:histidine kinase internal region [Paenibacillus mucilaginosus 3016]|uniref:histidine kinase n=1 Tax=Paenibacillus mucilaginosus 3016 TaxID=1116391 RepID=H6NP03_9BACL|nr:histidine kinase [Paenibacillus mucilaginosus]AFC31077.1 histidine kinase internal region [Paenibacillus mucilaginosus 3016]WFA19661.1 HAMP domain-containing protein [Paenibacillus mucilaginosus]